MMRFFRRFRKFFTVIVVQCLFISTLSSCDDEISNQECEGNCASDYVSEVETCEENTVDCMQGCTTPDNYDCMWNCESFEDVCTYEFNLCMVDCPCINGFQDCSSECDYGNLECIYECQDQYVDCAGEDSPYNCVIQCDGAKTICVYECDDYSDDMTSYLDCRAACHETFTECLNDC